MDYIPHSREGVGSGLCTVAATGTKIIMLLTVTGYSLKYRFSEYKCATLGYIFIKVQLVECGWMAPVLKINFVYPFSVTTLLLTISLNLIS